MDTSVSRGSAGDRVADAQRLFVEASRLAAARLTGLAAERKKDYINERDHLQPTYRAALEVVAAGASPAPTVSPTLGHGLEPAAWPRLGKFDVSLAWSEATVFGELKCGDSEKALSACAWDAAKCAFCLRHGIGAAMLLVAAAPKPLWRRRALGVELFNGGMWEMADVRQRYAAGFRTWEADGYKPVRVPAALVTEPVGQTDFLIAGKPWVLAVARVDPVGDGWMTWEPMLAPAS